MVFFFHRRCRELLPLCERAADLDGGGSFLCPESHYTMKNMYNERCKEVKHMTRIRDLRQAKGEKLGNGGQRRFAEAWEYRCHLPPGGRRGAAGRGSQRREARRTLMSQIIEEHKGAFDELAKY